MRAVGPVPRELVGQGTYRAPSTRLVRQYDDPLRYCTAIRLPSRLRHVFLVAGVESLKGVGLFDEAGRIRKGHHQFGEFGGAVVKILEGLAVRVVVETGSEPFKIRRRPRPEACLRSHRTRGSGQVVAEGRHDGPKPVTAADIAVH